MNYPKISIITVCLNSKDGIERTIQSVLSQGYENIEYIIIDGKSSDGTLDIIGRYKSKIALLVSEEDKGIYNAMNKGLGLMTGEIVLFLNSGDYLFDNDVISDVADVFRQKPEIQVLYGNVVNDYGKKRKLRKYKNINRLFFSCSTLCHQVIFAKRDVFVKYGYFDEKYTRNADYDWIMGVFFCKDITTYYFDRTISVYNMWGVSSSQIKFMDEIVSSKKKYFSNPELLLYYPICLIRQRFRKLFLEKRI
jgi:glycosyltransferase involved in cell wall biosynthesis